VSGEAPARGPPQETARSVGDRHGGGAFRRAEGGRWDDNARALRARGFRRRPQEDLVTRLT
jgi:hypothetical protein